MTTSARPRHGSRGWCSERPAHHAVAAASAYFSNGEDIWYAQRQFNIKLVSSVCAGDSTLAAFLHKWYDDRDNVEDALKLAIATGANVAESVGLGDFGHRRRSTPSASPCASFDR